MLTPWHRCFFFFKVLIFANVNEGRYYKINTALYSLQEKKGQENLKPEEKFAQKQEFEVAKMDKLLAMVRQPDPKEAAKAN